MSSGSRGPARGTGALDAGEGRRAGPRRRPRDRRARHRARRAHGGPLRPARSALRSEEETRERSAWDATTASLVSPAPRATSRLRRCEQERRQPPPRPRRRPPRGQRPPRRSPPGAPWRSGGVTRPSASLTRETRARPCVGQAHRQSRRAQAHRRRRHPRRCRPSRGWEAHACSARQGGARPVLRTGAECGRRQRSPWRQHHGGVRPLRGDDADLTERAGADSEHSGPAGIFGCTRRPPPPQPSSSSSSRRSWCSVGDPMRRRAPRRSPWRP